MVRIPLRHAFVVLFLCAGGIHAQTTGPVTANLTGVAAAAPGSGNLIVGPDCTLAPITSTMTGSLTYSFNLNVTCKSGVTASGAFQITLGASEVTFGQIVNNLFPELTSPLNVNASANLNITGSLPSGFDPTLSVTVTTNAAPIAYCAGSEQGGPSAPTTSASCSVVGMSPTSPPSASSYTVVNQVLFSLPGNAQFPNLTDSVTVDVFATYSVGCGTSAPSMSAASVRAGTAAASCTNTSITYDHMEVVQVIQGPENNIRLVQGKTAEVRIFAKASANNVPVTATLTSLGGRAASISTQGVLNMTLPDEGDYANGDGFGFQIDGSWVALGSDSLQVDIQTADMSASASNKDNPQPVTYEDNHWPQPYLVIPIVVCEFTTRFTYNCPGSESILDIPNDVSDIADFMQQVFPVPDPYLGAIGDKVNSGIVYEPPAMMHVDPVTTHVTVAGIAKKLLLFYLLLGLNNSAPDQLVAWVNQRGTFASPQPSLFQSSHVQVEEDQKFYLRNSYVMTSAIAASLGAAAGSKTDLPGFDTERGYLMATGTAALNPGRPSLSMEWISASQYTTLFDAFNSASSTNSKPAHASPKAASPASQYLTITGDVAASGASGDLDPGFVASSTVPPDPSDPNGNYCLRFSGPSGALGDYCFTVTFSPGLDPSPFGVRAPLPAGANHVGLVAANSSTELASFTANANLPTVQITSPATGASLTAGTLNLSWSGTSASPLAYNLLYSSDGGGTWRPIDTGLTASTYALDTTQITGGSQVMFQVQASDGLNTVTATVGPLTITQTPQLALPKGAVNFNKVLIGQGLDQPVVLQNTGSGPVTVSSASAGGAFRVVSAVPFSINPGGQHSVRVRYKPTSAGVQTNSLSISSNDPSQPNASVPLRAEAIANPESTVSLLSATVDFGNVVVGQSTTASFQVGSLGPATLNVSKFQSGNAAYSVMSPALPFSVAPGQQQSVTVQFAPTSTGAQNAVLTLTTDDPDLTSVTINATGAGVSANSGTPSFTLPGVVNAASGASGGVAPGEIVVVYGSSLGPAALAGLQLAGDGTVATSTGNTQVLFDGVPAPMVYALAGQVAAIVPYEVWTESSTQMQVISNGVKSNVAALPVVASTPGLFTATSSGSGQGSILNQDESVNSASNPAALGSVVILFGTGEGQTSPLGIDGLIAGTVLPSPISPVSVTIGGVNATVEYAGAAPGLVAGVLQVNAVVPNGLTTGNQPVVLTVGSTSSRAGVTVAVKGVSGPPPPNCTFSLSANSAGVAAAASSSNTVGVTASASSCAWTAVSNVPWITITSGAAGSGNGTVIYSVAANTGAAQSGTMTIAGLTFTVNQAAAATGPDTTSGLAGWWKFDESSGATVTDSSGNGNTGTIVGGVTRTAGMFGEALSFDGSTGMINGGSPGTGFPVGGSARTISAWVKITNPATTDNAILHYGTYGGSPPAVNFHLFVTGSGSKVGFGNGYGFGVIQGTTSIADGQWHNVVGVYEGTGTNIARIYVDGVQQSSGTLTTAPNTGTATPWRIGNFMAGGGAFRGLMDDVRIYNRALSPADLQAIFAGQ